jgi:hypothetical protein
VVWNVVLVAPSAPAVSRAAFGTPAGFVIVSLIRPPAGNPERFRRKVDPSGPLLPGMIFTAARDGGAGAGAWGGVAGTGVAAGGAAGGVVATAGLPDAFADAAKDAAAVGAGVEVSANEAPTSQADPTRASRSAAITGRMRPM